ncbi:MAG: hypothetical protein IRY85_11020, partial [Micromonosporaceae bacterium]|nr:hypothetical protein [Micromonosporaceae bacterium]
MDDPEIRERLIAYVSAEPPRTLTAEAILQAGRRVRRMSQLRVGSVAVVLVATAAAVPAVLTHQAVDGGNSAATVLNVERVCAAVAAPPRAVRDEDGFPPYAGTSTVDAETDALIDWRAARLRCAVTELVTSRLPDFRFHQVGDADTPPAQTLAPLEFYASPGGLRFTSTAVVVDDRGAVRMGFIVIRSVDIGREPDFSGFLGALCPSEHCLRGERGGRIAHWADDTSLIIAVDFGQTAVRDWMLAEDLRHWHSQPTAPPRAELPLSIEQFIEIATDPRLDVFAQPSPSSTSSAHHTPLHGHPCRTSSERGVMCG